LRILHLSHEGLPDWRIEKSALTAIKNGHEVVFAGSKSQMRYGRKTFSKVYEINWTAKARYGIPFYWNAVKKQVARVIGEAKPDIIHAHNIFSAKMLCEFEIPFVYDDHEYWSKHSQLLIEIENMKKPGKTKFNLYNTAVDKTRRLGRNLINRHVVRLWTKWEK
jgi:hypothetical protein